MTRTDTAIYVCGSSYRARFLVKREKPVTQVIFCEPLKAYPPAGSENRCAAKTIKEAGNTSMTLYLRTKKTAESSLYGLLGMVRGPADPLSLRSHAGETSIGSGPGGPGAGPAAPSAWLAVNLIRLGAFSQPCCGQKDNSPFWRPHEGQARNAEGGNQ